MVSSFYSKISLEKGLLSAIPTAPNGGNHTPEFTKAARSPEALKACLNISKALAATGVRVLTDDGFFKEVSECTVY